MDEGMGMTGEEFAWVLRDDADTKLTGQIRGGSDGGGVRSPPPVASEVGTITVVFD